MQKLKIGEEFRYAKPQSPEPEIIGKWRNHYFATNTPGQSRAQLEKGISPIGKIFAPDGERIPAILIRSSPHKIGSDETPWQDTFDPDNGYIRYYGDNKAPGKDPSHAPGNKILWEAYKIHSSIDINLRKKAIPLIFYKTVSREDKVKGFIEFNGFGTVQKIELVTQFDRKNRRAFPNYAFDLVIFDLSKDKEEFNWEWISDRRNPGLTIDQTMRYAPKSWKKWIEEGPKSIEKNRRNVSRLLITKTSEQQPLPNSREESALTKIYKYYTNKKHKFEGIASVITARYIKEAGGAYKEGWITPASQDHGADFFGRLDIGFGFGKVKVILLGQAKCESIKSPTSGTDIARTVARLKRGWVGAYVTTSYFSESVQREIIEDCYPILLINGMKIAEITLKIVHDDGYPNIDAFLQDVEMQYEKKISNRRPEELLLG
jgi:hypothetical protein